MRLEEEQNRNRLTDADPLLTEALRCLHGGVDIPDENAAWLSMEKRLGSSRNRRNWSHRIRMAAAAILITMMVDALFLNLKPVEAITGYFLKVRYGSSGVVSVQFGNYDMSSRSGAMTDPPPEEDFVGRLESGGMPSEPPGQGQGSTERKAYSLEEARKITAFDIIIPGEIPEGFRIKEVQPLVDEEDGKAYRVSILFSKDEGRSFYFTQSRNRAGGARGSITSTAWRNTKVEEVMVGSAPAVLITGDRNLILKWMTEYSSFEIQGDLDKKEAIKMAESVHEAVR